VVCHLSFGTYLHQPASNGLPFSLHYRAVATLHSSYVSAARPRLLSVAQPSSLPALKTE